MEQKNKQTDYHLFIKAVFLGVEKFEKLNYRAIRSRIAKSLLTVSHHLTINSRYPDTFWFVFLYN